VPHQRRGFLDAEATCTSPAAEEYGKKAAAQFSEEIEDTLRKHPDVADAAVVGFKSNEWGEGVKAFVVLNPGAECGAEALIQFCKQLLAPYKAPKAVEFLSALPRTGLGKIDRGKLGGMHSMK
jgi:acyl-CoA synthetase (AMP-forming)/AMP-acid ligase II